jgi:hypothetical protein
MSATPKPEGAWFNPLARFLGPAYLRNAFTKRPDQRRRSRTGNLARRRLKASTR